MNTVVIENQPVARVYGEQLMELPLDLYIPPDALEVFLETFEGPLDLLLYLIRRQNLDVLNIPMAEVTRQYMTYVEAMRARQLELAAEYLLMAAMLIEIKSRMLLPRPVHAEDEEHDPRADLVRRLLEYERMKLAGRQLDALPQAGRDFALVEVWLEQASEKRLPEVNQDDLRAAWAAVVARVRAHRHHHVSREELSVREHMTLILRRLQGRQFVEFATLFAVENGVAEVVVTFLAMLELARESLVEISQAEVFAPIYVKLAESGAES
ncbi:segregation and condensation protein A [Sulfurimicrobium lacus]|uniref:Segregation and condensation protein A n=2 Tax=Sulfurimicrobium lacus TaxID=2715678 RepID=A0A6F8VFD2_9PROT|nr:segregation and condensation protein A [Sulfurimicrobium lacus]